MSRELLFTGEHGKIERRFLKRGEEDRMELAVTGGVGIEALFDVMAELPDTGADRALVASVIARHERSTQLLLTEGGAISGQGRFVRLRAETLQSLLEDQVLVRKYGRKWYSENNVDFSKAGIFEGNPVTVVAPNVAKMLTVSFSEKQSMFIKLLKDGETIPGFHHVMNALAKGIDNSLAEYAPGESCDFASHAIAAQKVFDIACKIGRGIEHTNPEWKTPQYRYYDPAIAQYRGPKSSPRHSDFTHSAVS